MATIGADTAENERHFALIKHFQKKVGTLGGRRRRGGPRRPPGARGPRPRRRAAPLLGAVRRRGHRGAEDRGGGREGGSLCFFKIQVRTDYIIFFSNF